MAKPDLQTADRGSQRNLRIVFKVIPILDMSLDHKNSENSPVQPTNHEEALLHLLKTMSAAPTPVAGAPSPRELESHLLARTI